MSKARKTVQLTNVSRSTLQRIKAKAARFGIIGDAPAVRFALEQYVAGNTIHSLEPVPDPRPLAPDPLENSPC